MEKIDVVIRRISKRFKSVGKKEILVLGDSHATVLDRKDAMIPGHWFKVVSVGGATISGLQNPKSVTQAMPIFKKAIKRYRGNICITLLGEVDTGFVIWYRAQKHGLDVQKVLDQTIERYIKFIKSIPQDKHVIIVSAPLPTIQDGQDWGEVANLRKEVAATLEERTNITVKLNRCMEMFAADNEVMYLNLDSLSLGENGVVKSELLNANPKNHHYGAKAYLKILMPGLSSLIEKIGADKLVA